MVLINIMLLILLIGLKTISAGKFNLQTVVEVKEAVQSKTSKVVSQLDTKLQNTSKNFLKGEGEPLRKDTKNSEEPIFPDSMLLDVPLLNQMDQPKLFNGCEVTSLAMILNYHGMKVTKTNWQKI